MTGNALALANRIIAYRTQALLTVPALDNTLAGVAQWHADDMAANGYVGLVGSDGEDPYSRLVNSGWAFNTLIGAIAGGYSTDMQTIFEAMQTDFSANSILVYNAAPPSFRFIGVGYKNGYWMVLMSR